MGKYTKTYKTLIETIQLKPVDCVRVDLNYPSYNGEDLVYVVPRSIENDASFGGFVIRKSDFDDLRDLFKDIRIESVTSGWKEP